MSLRNKFKQLSVTLAALLMLAVPAVVPATVGAQNLKQRLCTGTETASGERCDSGANPDSKISDIIETVVRIFTLIVGAASVIMIIFGGFRYITSGGDSSKVTSAKNTIMYALIGLVIAVLAQVLVNFVLSQV